MDILVLSTTKKLFKAYLNCCSQLKCMDLLISFTNIPSSMSLRIIEEEELLERISVTIWWDQQSTDWFWAQNKGISSSQSSAGNTAEHSSSLEFRDSLTIEIGCFFFIVFFLLLFLSFFYCGDSNDTLIGIFSYFCLKKRALVLWEGELCIDYILMGFFFSEFSYQQSLLRDL